MNEAKASASSLESAFSSLKSARESMVLAGSEGTVYKNIQNLLFKTLEDSRGGNFSGLDTLTPNLSSLTGDNRSLFSSETKMGKEEAWAAIEQRLFAE